VVIGRLWDNVEFGSRAFPRKWHTVHWRPRIALWATADRFSGTVWQLDEPIAILQS